MTAYAMYREGFTFPEALEYVTSKRKKVYPNQGFRKQLEDFDKELQFEKSYEKFQ